MWAKDLLKQLILLVAPDAIKGITKFIKRKFKRKSKN